MVIDILPVSKMSRKNQSKRIGSEQFEDIPEIPAEPDSGSCAKAELGNDLVPRFEDVAEPYRVKSFSLVVWDSLLFYLLVQRKHLKAFAWECAGLARHCPSGDGYPQLTTP